MNKKSKCWGVHLESLSENEFVGVSDIPWELRGCLMESWPPFLEHRTPVELMIQEQIEPLIFTKRKKHTTMEVQELKIV